jgi:hypothetical protein
MPAAEGAANVFRVTQATYECCAKIRPRTIKIAFGSGGTNFRQAMRLATRA